MRLPPLVLCCRRGPAATFMSHWHFPCMPDGHELHGACLPPTRVNCLCGPHCDDVFSRALTVVVQVSKDSDNFCCIEYGLEARLDRPGIFNFDAKDKSEITIFNKPQDNAVNNVPIRVEPETETVTNWCCSSKGRSVAAMKIFPVVYLVLNSNTLILACRRR